jgi:hypothetical protein
MWWRRRLLHVPDLQQNSAASQRRLSHAPSAAVEPAMPGRRPGSQIIRAQMA